MLAHLKDVQKSVPFISLVKSVQSIIVSVTDITSNNIKSLFNFDYGFIYKYDFRLCDISEEELEEERKRWNLPIEQYNKAKEKLETYVSLHCYNKSYLIKTL